MTPRQIEIIETAIELIKNEGLSSLTMKNLAEKMEFSEPALYRHFKDKKELMLTIIEMLKMNFQNIIDTIDVTAPPETFFENFMLLIFDYIQKVEGVPMLILSESTLKNDEEIRHVMYNMFQNLVSFLSHYIAIQQNKGHIKKHLDPKIIGAMFFGIIQSRVIQYHLSNKNKLLNNDSRTLLEIFTKGVLS